MVLALAAGCSLASAGSDTISEFTPDSIRDADRARQALTASTAARVELRDEVLRKQYDCHQRIAVNRCLAQVDSERRQMEAKLGAIEIHARQVVRNARLAERNAAESQRPPRPAAGAAQPAPAVEAPKKPAQVAPTGAADATGQAASVKSPASPPAPGDGRLEKRLDEQAARAQRHQTRLQDGQADAAKEQNRRQTRQAEIEQKKRDHAVKLEQARSNAARYEERQRQAEKRQLELAKKRDEARAARSP